MGKGNQILDSDYAVPKAKKGIPAGLPLRIQAFTFDFLLIVAIVYIFYLFNLFSLLVAEGSTYKPLILLFIVLLLIKDFWKGQSIGKRFFEIEVVNYEHNPASALQCVGRNISSIFLPFDIFMLLATREIRIGDLFAGTRVNKMYIQPNSLFHDILNMPWGKSQLYALLLMLGTLIFAAIFIYA